MPAMFGIKTDCARQLQTLVGGGGRQPMIIEEVTPRIIGQMDNTIDHTFESANRVYDLDGIAPALNTCIRIKKLRIYED